MKKKLNKRVQGTLHKVSGPLTPDVGNMNPMPISRFYVRFALICATVMTAFTLILDLASRFSNMFGAIYRFIVSIPWVTTWILEATVYTRHPYPEGGTMERFLAGFLWVFIFLQWFIVGLAIAFVFRLIRLKSHNVTAKHSRED